MSSLDTRGDDASVVTSWTDLGKRLGDRLRTRIWHKFRPADTDMSAKRDANSELRDALEAVELLLDYLARLPEARLAPAFAAAAGGNARRWDGPQPPTDDLATFLCRIARIGRRVRGDSETPACTNEPAPADEPGDRLDDLSFLRWSRDFLSGLASPATVETISVTRAYRRHRLASLRSLTPAGQSLRDRQFTAYGGYLARRVARYQVLVYALLFVSFWASVLTYAGNTLLRENGVLQQAQKELLQRMTDALNRDAPMLRSMFIAGGDTNAALLVRGYCDYQFRLHPVGGTEPHGAQFESRAGAPLAARLNDGSGERVATLPFRYAAREAVNGDIIAWISQRQLDVCDERSRLLRREAELKVQHWYWMRAAGPAVLTTTLPSRLLEFVGLTGFGSLRPRGDAHPPVAGTQSAVPVTSGEPATAPAGVAHNPPATDRGEALGRVPGAPTVAATDYERRLILAQHARFLDFDLESHRIMMQQSVQGLIGNIMPTAYAALGALASMFRRIGRKAQTETLGSGDYGGMQISFVLGLLTGAVIALFADGLKAADGGLPLGTTAFALLAGFAADRVFAMFDQIADRLFGAQQQPSTDGRRV